MATTINAYSVGLQLDARNYIQNSRLSRSETSQLTRSINAARTPADKYNRQVSLLEKSLASGAISQRTYNRLLDDANRKFKRAKTSAKAYGNSFVAIGKNIGIATAGFVAFNQLRAGIQDNISAESMGLQFEVLTRNAATAKRLMQQLRAFSARTPFQFTDLAQAGRQLLAFGFTADQVIDNVRVLGNLAAGTGNNISELAEIIGKARVQGRLFNEDINQLTGRGINVIDGLAKKFGDVKNAAADGRIQFSDLQEVLQALTTDGGQFAGMMERMSETTAGKISTLTDNLKQLRMEMTESFTPAATSGVGILGRVAQGFSATFGFGAYNRIIEWEKEQTRRQNADSRFAIEQRMNSQAARLRGRWARGITAIGGFGDLANTASGTASGVSGGIFAGLKSAATQLSYAARGQLGAHQAQIASIQRQEQIEREKARKPSPAIKSLEVGTQEAYKFLSQETTAANKLAEEAEKKRAADMEKGRAQAETMIEYLKRVADLVAENGFQAIR